MSRLGSLLIAIWAVAPVAALAQSGADRAVIGVLKRSEPSLQEIRVWHRVGVTGELDLVLAMGTRSKRHFDETFNHYVWWATSEQLGLFLQERVVPYRVFSLAAVPGPNCAARILRATATDTVISCTGERSEVYPNQKFVYDVRAKRLVSHFSYQPFSMYGAVGKTGRSQSHGARITGANSTQQIIVDFEPDRVPEFRLVAGRKATPDELLDMRHRAIEPPFVAPRFGPSATFSLIDADPDEFERDLVVREVVGKRNRHYRLPRSTYDAFAKARPRRVRNGYTEETSGFEEQIGPWQVEDDKLWIGKTFYDSEGITGIGGFGYFDPREQRYHLYTSSLIADWSVSAISVQPDAVWLALFSRGEYGDNGGGLVRFDRESEEFLRVTTGEEIGREFVRLDDRLLLATDIGITVVREDQAKKYIVDQTTDGRLRIVPADK